jgi:hypothetical protein
MHPLVERLAKRTLAGFDRIGFLVGQQPDQPSKRGGGRFTSWVSNEWPPVNPGTSTDFLAGEFTGLYQPVEVVQRCPPGTIEPSSDVRGGQGLGLVVSAGEDAEYVLVGHSSIRPRLAHT